MSEHQITPFVADGQPTMSSRDIADVCGARHNDVVATIERLFAKGVLRESRNTTRAHSPEGGGRPTEVYDLTERDTLVVVSGYKDEVRAKIIDQWQALKARVAPSPLVALNDPAALRAALLGYTEQVIALEAANVELEHQIEEIAPKAAIYDKYLNADGLMSLQDLGRALGQGPNKFIERLKGKWLFESRGTLIPHSRFADEGIKIFTVKSRMYGEKLRRQTMATPKAIPYFAKKLGAQPSGTAH